MREAPAHLRRVRRLLSAPVAAPRRVLHERHVRKRIYEVRLRVHDGHAVAYAAEQAQGAARAGCGGGGHLTGMSSSHEDILQCRRKIKRRPWLADRLVHCRGTPRDRSAVVHLIIVARS